jgi:hypothetical protein
MMGPDQVMEGMTGNGQDRLAVEFGVIEAIEEVNPARA